MIHRAVRPFPPFFPPRFRGLDGLRFDSERRWPWGRESSWDE